MPGVDLSRCQNAFPLPYGENLGETEAFHLIRAFELYNELRTLVSDIQALDIRELPVRHYDKRALTPRSLNVKLGPLRNYHKGRAAIRHYANHIAYPL